MRKLLQHIAFWLVYWLVYAYTYSRYDENFLKYLLAEGLQMPARMLSTYAGFWMLHQWQNRGWWTLSGVAAATVTGGLFNRFLKWWYLVPAYFPDATIEYWDLSRLVVDIFDCALATGVALSVRLFFRQQESLRRESQLKQEKTEAELRALKNQLQPHFLFNTINNLYALARIKSEKTAPVALQLANLLRFVLYETRKETIPLEQELKILQDYIALEQLRFDEDRLRIKTQLDIDDPSQPIVPLLLLPLVENAFKHGVGEERSDAWVSISVQLSGKTLTVQVENSLPEKHGNSPGGIGLNNIRQQLALRYPEQSQLYAGYQPESSSKSAHFLASMQIRF